MGAGGKCYGNDEDKASVIVLKLQSTVGYTSESVVCESCLEWFHLKCIGLKRPRRIGFVIHD